MKKIVVFLSLFLSLGLIVQAQVKLERNTAGEYRVEVANKNWSPTNIVADSATLRYMAFFDEAISPHPKPVLVYKNEKVIKLKPVFKKLVEIESDRIIYNQTTKKISLLVDKRREVKSSYLILFALMSIMSMMLSDFFQFFKENATFAAIAAFIAAFTATFAAIATLTATFAATLVATLVAIFAAIVAILATPLLADEKLEKSIIFYILMTIYVVSLYV